MRNISSSLCSILGLLQRSTSMPMEVLMSRNHSSMSQRQVAGFKLIQQLLQQSQLVLVLVALGVIEQSAGGLAEHADQFQERETASGLLCARLGISALVFASVGRAGAGAVNHFDTEAAPPLADFFSVRGGSAAQA